jgi:hypothetical protein
VKRSQCEMNRWALPYCVYQPELAFVLEDSIGVCGYVLGALDSKSFYEKLDNEWFVSLRQKYPLMTEGNNPCFDVN